MQAPRDDAPHSGYFQRGSHRFAVRVYFEDTDLTGIVYHANYLRYMERARSDMLRLAGIDQRAAHEGGEGAYTVVAIAIRYRNPARLDEALVVVSDIGEIRAASCVIQQRVMRANTILTEAEVTAALVSAKGRPLRQPRAWVDAFKRLQAGDFQTDE